MTLSFTNGISSFEAETENVFFFTENSPSVSSGKAGKLVCGKLRNGSCRVVTGQIPELIGKASPPGSGNFSVFKDGVCIAVNALLDVSIGGKDVLEAVIFWKGIAEEN